MTGLGSGLGWAGPGWAGLLGWTGLGAAAGAGLPVKKFGFQQLLPWVFNRARSVEFKDFSDVGISV